MRCIGIERKNLNVRKQSIILGIKRRGLDTIRKCNGVATALPSRWFVISVGRAMDTIEY
jgi:hypothetical protein